MIAQTLMLVGGLGSLVVLYLLGQSNWALGLTLGGLVCWVNLGWIRWTIGKSLGKGPQAVRRTLLGHSVGRYLLAGLVAYGLLRLSVMHVIAFLLGYAGMQWLTAVWQLNRKTVKREI